MCVGLRGAAQEGYIIMFPAVMVCRMGLIFDIFFKSSMFVYQYQFKCI